MTDGDARYAVIGESEGYPILYHMNQTAKAAEGLRERREAHVGTPCFVVSMGTWHADPLGALRAAQGGRHKGGGGDDVTSTYDRLGDGGPLGSIAAIGTDEIAMTFAEVEAIVGPLPGDARRSAPWWSVSCQPSYRNAYVVHWRHRGYVADRPDFAAETVTLRRVKR